MPGPHLQIRHQRTSLRLASCTHNPKSTPRTPKGGNDSGPLAFSHLKASVSFLFYRIKEQFTAAAIKKKEAGNSSRGKGLITALPMDAGFLKGSATQSGPHHFFLDDLRASELSPSKEKLCLPSPCADLMIQVFHQQGAGGGTHTTSKRSLKLGLNLGSDSCFSRDLGWGPKWTPCNHQKFALAGVLSFAGLWKLTKCIYLFISWLWPCQSVRIKSPPPKQGLGNSHY